MRAYVAIHRVCKTCCLIQLNGIKSAGDNP